MSGEDASFKLVQPKKNILDLVSEKAKDMVRELEMVHQEKNSPEKEKKLDTIYKNLIDLSRNIKREKKLGNSRVDTDELFFLITNMPNASRVQAFDNYGDTFDMFLDDNPSEKTTTFLSKMSVLLNNKDPVAIKNPKEIIYQALHNCQRKTWLENTSEDTCEHCWATIMEETFIMSSKTFTVEIQAQLVKIQEMFEFKRITLEDSVFLEKVIANTLIEVSKLVDTVDKQKKTMTKQQWTMVLESLFLVIVQMTNEIMLTLVKNQMKI
jgi:hypothetical protein